MGSNRKFEEQTEQQRMAYVEAQLVEILRMEQDAQIFNYALQVEEFVEELGRNGFIAGNRIC